MMDWYPKWGYPTKLLSFDIAGSWHLNNVPSSSWTARNCLVLFFRRWESVCVEFQTGKSNCGHQSEEKLVLRHINIIFCVHQTLSALSGSPLPRHRLHCTSACSPSHVLFSFPKANIWYLLIGSCDFSATGTSRTKNLSNGQRHLL